MNKAILLAYLRLTAIGNDYDVLDVKVSKMENDEHYFFNPVTLKKNDEYAVIETFHSLKKTSYAEIEKQIKKLANIKYV